jgi:ubiquinone/menaquinone biosynthesis C-methylase UbiE
MIDKNYKKIVCDAYNNILNREPDKEGFEHYLTQLMTGSITPKELESIFKNSFEYKLSHPVNYNSIEISVEDKMKREWNERTKMNPLFVIATDHSESKKDFWKSGIDECNRILGKNTHRFEKIIENKELSKMDVLEIGCGIGRILVPMSKIFGNVTGIDISSEMIQLGQKYVRNISNCSILENNGIDLSMFLENSFDFCYSFIVFQHIPDKKIIENYIKEVSRILKSSCIFRFQVRGIIDTKPKEITTWDGVQFSSTEMHKMAKENNFEIIEEGNDKEEYYWLTFKSKN